MPPKKNPLVILGFDAALPNLLLEGAAQGTLPTLQSVMKNGTWGKINGQEMLFEHGFWPSLFSGISRKDHGYYYFRQMAPRTYELKTFSGKLVNVPPFWTRFQGKEIEAAILDIPDSFTVPGVKGIQLTEWAAHNSLYPPETVPSNLIREVKKVFGKQMVIDELFGSTVEQDRKIYNRLIDRVKKKGRMVRHLLSKGKFDLVVSFFSESHAGTHQFWKYYSQGSAEYRRDPRGELTRAIHTIYALIDEEFGQILKLLPQNANCFLISSSGMQDQYPCTQLIESFCRQLGYQILKKSEARPKRGIDLLRQVVPEKWRIAVSQLILSREQKEGLLSDQLKNYTDWGKTRAFAVTSFFNSYLRVNLRGRESEGIVSPTEYKPLLDQIERDLLQLTDAATGQTIVQQVHRTTEFFNMPPHETLPDLVMQWKPIPHLLEKVLHPKCVLRQDKPAFYRGNDHTHEGFYAASGPGISRRGEGKDASVLDFVPAFLKLLEEPASETKKLEMILT